MCPFYSGNCTKITKTKTQKNPKSFSSNRYCLFTSHQNSLHLAACMKQFSLQTTQKAHFCYFLSYCMAVLKLVFFFVIFFVVFYAKGREASDNLYTVYTAHPSNPSLPPTHTLSASYQNIRTWRLPLHFPKTIKKKKERELLCFKRQLWPDWGTKP